MSTSIDPPLVEITPEHAVDVATTATEVIGAEDLEISAHKKEYSIVGDALYATSLGATPMWLSEIIDSVIGNSLGSALSGVSAAKQDLSDALSSMHIAKNSYEEFISIQATENQATANKLNSLSADINSQFSTISAAVSELQTTSVTEDRAIALVAEQVSAALTTPGQALHGSVSHLQNVVTSLNNSVTNNYEDSALQFESLEDLVFTMSQDILSVEAEVSGVTVGSRNLIEKTSEEEDGPNYEFFAYRDMAPTFEEYGLVQYTIGVDLRSPVPGNVDIYAQNGSGTRYSIGTKTCDVTTEWKRFTYTFTPTESDMAQTKAMVAFFGTYGTGRNIKLRRFKLERGNRASDWTPAPEDVSQAAVDAADAAEQAAKDYADTTFVDNVSYGIDKQQIQEQLDGSITTWFMPGVPLPAETTLPASDWTTTALKDLHIDDLYYDDDTGFVYRYKNVGGTYSWYRIVDQDVIDALDAASNAQDTADSKRRVFFTEGLPQPPYDKGDLWDTGAGLKRATKARAAPYTTEGGVVVASPPSTFDWTPIADEYGAAGSVYAKTERTMTSFAALDSAGNPIVSAKFGVNLTTAIDGSVLIGGFDFDNDGTKVTAAFNVDEFKVGRADASGVSPFELIGQEVFIKDAFINTLDLKKLRLDGADVISTVGGVSKIKADYLEVEDVDISGLLSATDGTFSGTLDIGGGTGARMEITNEYIKVYDGISATPRVQIGNLSV